jgi:diguanylate cyclase (GGDEF)-like protein
LNVSRTESDVVGSLAQMTPPGEERRDLTARALRDSLAEKLGVHSREFATTSREALDISIANLNIVYDRIPKLEEEGDLDELTVMLRRGHGMLTLYGLAAIVTAMARSLDVLETAEVAIVESLAALRLSTGALWARERSAFKLLHAVGLHEDHVEGFAMQAGPRLKASTSAVARSDSRVDRVSGPEWYALRAQLRVHGRTVGMMTVGTMADHVFNATDILFLAMVADQVAIAVDRARQFSREARTDHLTRLANQREFERVMEREVALAERHDRRLSMMMIDLDNLKGINDRHGRRVGDEALKLVAQQLLRVVRATDVCARVGGDEFAVAMPETELGRMREVAQRLRSAVQQMNFAAKSTMVVEVNVGFAAWRPGQDWKATYKAANTDLFEDKRRRKTLPRGEDEPPAPTRLLERTGRRRSSAPRDARPTTRPGPTPGL